MFNYRDLMIVNEKLSSCQTKLPPTKVARTEQSTGSRRTKSASEPGRREPISGKSPSTRAGCSLAHFTASTSEHPVALIKPRIHSSIVAIDPHNVFVPFLGSILFHTFLTLTSFYVILVERGFVVRIFHYSYKWLNIGKIFKTTKNNNLVKKN